MTGTDRLIAAQTIGGSAVGAVDSTQIAAICGLRWQGHVGVTSFF